MTPSLTMNWEQPWRPHFAVYELAGQLRELPCDLRGLVRDFRDYAWVHFGLPATMEALEGIALSFRFSRYKFRKYWETTLKKFFTESDGKLYYADDEHHRTVARENHDKAREYGRLGVVAKRNKQAGLQFSGPGIPQAPLQPPLHHTETETDRYSNTATADNTTNVVAAAVDSNCPTAYKLIASIFADVTPAFIGRLLGEAQKILPDVGDEDLALAIRATYKPNGKQKTAGLFLETVPAWLRNQQPKKPQLVEQTISGVIPGREADAAAFLIARAEGRGKEFLEEYERRRKVSGV